MFGLKSSSLYSQCLVELENQILHPLSGTDNEPWQRPGVVWLEEPAYGQGGYGDGVSLVLQNSQVDTLCCQGVRMWHTFGLAVFAQEGRVTYDSVNGPL